MKHLVVTGAALALASGLTAPGAAADTVADFYKGKTVTILIGFPPGGGYDANGRALARYLLAWLWFLPALGTTAAAGLKSGAAATAITLAGMVAYALVARLHPSRQFLHDVLCRTRLVHWEPAPPPAAASTAAAR